MRDSAFVAAVLLLVGRCFGIGRICRNVNDCPNGQYCIGGNCRCNNGQVLMNNRCFQNNYCRNGEQVYYNGQCYFLSSIGQRCAINEQCYGESYCINGYCTCIQGMVNVNGICQNQNPGNQCGNQQVFVSGRCLNIAPIGGACEVNAQCTGGAQCLNQQCACPVGTVQNGQMCTRQNCPENEILVNGTCMPRAIPGQQCQNSAQCLDGSQCSAAIHFCICPEGMNNVGGYCRKLVYTSPCDSASAVYAGGRCSRVEKPGGQCAYDSQCLGGSACTNGYCNCPRNAAPINGYCVGPASCDQNEILLNNRCFRKVGFNQSCSINEQCPDNAICNYAALCTCPSGMRIVDGRCHSYDTNQCQDTEIMVNGQCLRRRIPGTTCYVDEQCLDESLCINGYCNCPLGSRLLSGYCVPQNTGGNCGTHQIYVNGQCLNLAPPGYECVNNLQCLSSSTCPAGKCVCSDGYTEVRNYCIRNSRPSTQCSYQQILLNGRCYDRAEVGQYCIDTAVCLGGSFCYNNYCTCPPGTVAQNNQCQKQQQCSENEVQLQGRCYPRANIGQYCQFTEQCMSNSSCQNGVCTCPPGTVPLNNACQPQSPCASGQVYFDGKCWSTAYIGQYCQITQQCQGGSQCVNNICKCPSGTTAQGGQCISGQQCSNNQIMINGMCYKMANIGEFCYYSQQCKGNAECQLSRCTCPSGTVSANGTCVVNSNCQQYQVLLNGLCLDTVSIGMSCQDTSQCIASASCVSGTNSGSATGKTCQCNSGTLFTGSSCTVASAQCPPSTVFISERSCQSLVQIGQFCLYTSQCMGYSVCSGQMCKCPTDYAEVRNVCRRLK